jgi:hypothetical protein
MGRAAADSTDPEQFGYLLRRLWQLRKSLTQAQRELEAK